MVVMGEANFSSESFTGFIHWMDSQSEILFYWPKQDLT